MGSRSIAGKVSSIRNQIESALHQMPEFERLSDSIKLSMTGEWLRIDRLETEQGMFFVIGSAALALAAQAESLLSTLAHQIGSMPKYVGDRGPYGCQAVPQRHRHQRLQPSGVGGGPRQSRHGACCAPTDSAPDRSSKSAGTPTSARSTRGIRMIRATGA